MTNFKKNAAILFFCISCFGAFSQIKVDYDGRTLYGNPTSNSGWNDPNKYCSMNAFGLGTDSYRAGAKISFGDFSQSATGGMNAFIGEFSNYDSDILNPHGRQGIYFSTGGSTYNGASPFVVAKMEPSGELRVYGNVTANYVSINSDIRLKKNVKSITSIECLNRIIKLNAISYDFKTEKEDSVLVSIGESMKNAKNSEKELQSLKNFKQHLEKKKLRVASQIGFSAQDVQKVIPEIVSEDNENMLAVNYTALIPLLTEAIKEQQAIIDAQRAEMDAMKKDLAKIKAKLGM
jgi:flagellar biosynthesis chaperone FliJ